MEHTYPFHTDLPEQQERRLIYFNGPETREANEQQDESSDERQKTEKKVESMADNELDELEALIKQQEEARKKVREIDEKVNENIRKKASLIYKNEAELVKMIDDLTKEHFDDYNGLKSEGQIRRDVAWNVLYNVRNFPMKGMDQVQPRYSFDKEGRIQFEDEVTLLEPTPENIRAQALQAVEFLKDNLKDAKDLNQVYWRTVMPLGNFRLLNQRQQLAAATMAMRALEKEKPEIFSPPGAFAMRAELQLENGRYLIPSKHLGSPRSIKPDMSIFEEEGKKKEEEK